VLDHWRWKDEGGYDPDKKIDGKPVSEIDQFLMSKIDIEPKKPEPIDMKALKKRRE
jgi:hypothetical protein